MSKKIYIGSTEIAGGDGRSAYQIWLDEGNVGTEEQFMASLNGVGIASVTQTTTSSVDGGTNVWTVTKTDGTSSTFQVKNGNQGNSGYSGAAGELEVVNNLTSTDATAALSANMGRVLDEEISQLGLEMSGFPVVNETITGWGHYVGNYNLKSGVKYTVIINSPTTGITLHTRWVDAAHTNLTSTKTLSSFPATFDYTPAADYDGAQLYLGLDGTGTFEITVPIDSLTSQLDALKEQIISTGGITVETLAAALPSECIAKGYIMNSSGVLSANANYNTFFLPTSLIRTGEITVFGPSASTSNYIINACGETRNFISNIANYPTSPVEILLSNYPSAKYISLSINKNFTTTSIETNYVGDLRSDVADVRSMAFQHHLTGANNAEVSQVLKGLLSNSSYRVEFKGVPWDITGVTGAGANVFRVRNKYNGTYKDITNTTSGQTIRPWYDFTVPAQSDQIDICIRATSGVVVYFDVYKVTKVSKASFFRTMNHRGFHTVAPENTLPAFRLSALRCFDGIETDIRFTSDGVPVLLHDASINRTARNADGSEISGTINIADITYEQALTYDFGIWMGNAYAGTKIPTFEELLACCRNLGLTINAELKGGTDEQLANLVKTAYAFQMADRITWTSFNIQYLTKAHNYDPSARLGLTVDADITQSDVDNMAVLKGNNDVFIAGNITTLSQTGIERCKASGIQLEAYIVNTVAEAEGLDSYVSGATTDLLNVSEIIYWNELHNSTY